MRVREILQRTEDSPEWQDALRLLAGRLEPAEGDARRPGAEGRRAARSTQELSPKMLQTGDRLERDALAGVCRASRRS